MLKVLNQDDFFLFLLFFESEFSLLGLDPAKLLLHFKLFLLYPFDFRLLLLFFLSFLLDEPLVFSFLFTILPKLQIHLKLLFLLLFLTLFLPLDFLVMLDFG